MEGKAYLVILVVASSNWQELDTGRWFMQRRKDAPQRAKQSAYSVKQRT